MGTPPSENPMIGYRLGEDEGVYEYRWLGNHFIVNNRYSSRIMEKHTSYS
ncbi:predicted protein [Sclerotinia sclerotiorum 1980 UF-70]|uniref:Uncharacterized protein n=1 Tax=Sclerotinia sclerotiorum (strain ATCC 18683 / 1980 / Ss-1) TaxID=665079 RepID=A7EPT7_SCLS1|nr:predicted protein [Sclerotinia sclerotiorum 1980 UF-70]EDO04853.1 predicted protein [Sclerotinia sclerotiorum 1980 UF-70]